MTVEDRKLDSWWIACGGEEKKERGEGEREQGAIMWIVRSAIICIGFGIRGYGGSIFHRWASFRSSCTHTHTHTHSTRYSTTPVLPLFFCFFYARTNWTLSAGVAIRANPSLFTLIVSLFFRAVLFKFPTASGNILPLSTTSNLTRYRCRFLDIPIPSVSFPSRIFSSVIVAIARVTNERNRQEKS